MNDGFSETSHLPHLSALRPWPSFRGPIFVAIDPRNYFTVAQRVCSVAAPRKLKKALTVHWQMASVAVVCCIPGKAVLSPNVSWGPHTLQNWHVATRAEDEEAASLPTATIGSSEPCRVSWASN